MASNRPHFHVWRMAKTGKIFYKLAKPHFTRQVAGKLARRLEPDPARRMVIQCDCPECAPKLD